MSGEEAAEEPRPPREGPRPHEAVHDRWALVIVGAAFVAGLVMRVWILRSGLGAADLDEATVGLQARLFGEGRRNAYFPNQEYGGTLETGLIAVVFSVLGESVLVLKLVPIVLHLGACVAIWRTACWLTRSPIGQLLPPILLWLGSPFGVWWSTKARGFYGVLVLLAALVLLLVVRLHARRSWSDVALLGLCVGIGAWTTPLALAVLVPPIVWLVVTRPHLAPMFVAAIPTAVLGAWPALVANADSGGASFASSPGLESTWSERFGDWFERLPTLVGLVTPFEDERRLVAGSVGIVVIVAIVAMSTYASRSTAPGLTAAGVAGYALVYAANPMAVAVGRDARYLYGMLPILALAAGLAASRITPPSGRRPLAELAAMVTLAAVLCAWGIAGLVDVAGERHPDPFLASPGIEGVVAALDAHGVTSVTTDESGTQIMFASGGRIDASSFAAPRFDDVEDAVAVEGRCAYVIRRDGAAGSRNVGRVRDHLEDRGIAYAHERSGVYDVFVFARPVPPWDIGLYIYASLAERRPGEQAPTECAPRTAPDGG